MVDDWAVLLPQPIAQCHSLLLLVTFSAFLSAKFGICTIILKFELWTQPCQVPIGLQDWLLCGLCGPAMKGPQHCRPGGAMHRDLVGYVLLEFCFPFVVSPEGFYLGKDNTNLRENAVEQKVSPSSLGSCWRLGNKFCFSHHFSCPFLSPQISQISLPHKALLLVGYA